TIVDVFSRFSPALDSTCCHVWRAILEKDCGFMMCSHFLVAISVQQIRSVRIDNRQRELFRIRFDTADVPRDQFVVAGDARSLCRGGRTNPSAFGILDMHGLWFIAGNLIRDVAALNNREMLPWDVWGAMRRQDSELDLAFF